MPPAFLGPRQPLAQPTLLAALATAILLLVATFAPWLHVALNMGAGSFGGFGGFAGGFDVTLFGALANPDGFNDYKPAAAAIVLLLLAGAGLALVALAGHRALLYGSAAAALTAVLIQLVAVYGRNTGGAVQPGLGTYLAIVALVLGGVAAYEPWAERGAPAPAPAPAGAPAGPGKP